MQDQGISIIIPAFNEARNLVPCLSSLQASEFESFEVVCVDDASDDRSGEVAASYGSRVLRLGRRSGPAAARNRGATVARYGILLFLDADVTVFPDTLTKVHEGFRDNPGIQALFGSYSENTPVPSFFSQYKNLQHHYTHQSSSEEAATFWAGCGAILTDVFQKVGGFDEGFRRPSVEDIALGYTLREKGYRVLLKKDVFVTHLKRYTFLSLIKSDLFGRAIPWTRLMLDRGRFQNDLNTRTSNALSLMTCYALLAAPLFGKSGWPFWFALCSGLFLFLNRAFLALASRQGFRFLAAAALMLFFSYLYSGLGLGMGCILHIWHRFRS